MGLLLDEGGKVKAGLLQVSVPLQQSLSNETLIVV